MRTFLIITLTFLLAIVLEIVPMPLWAVWARPEWVLLILIYWALMAPDRVGVGIAFLIGLLMDLLMGTLLGEHALAFVLITYFVVRFGALIRLFPLWQQAFLVFFFVFLCQAFKFWVWGSTGGLSLAIGWLYWLPGMISAVLWPWVYTLLRGYQSRYRAY